MSVDFENDEYNDYIRKLKDYCGTHRCYALAPVQIGIPQKIIYIKNTQQDMSNNIEGYDEGIIYIHSIGHTRFLEGCASCMYKKNGRNIYYVGVLDRPYSLEIEYYDIFGNIVSKTIEGFETTAFSHEFDHLDGILHIDKVDEIMKMTKDEIFAYRSEHPYEIIDKEEDFKMLLKK